MENNEARTISVIAVCVAFAVCTMFLSAEGCNNSDNALKQVVVEHGCSYLGDSKFICGNVVRGAIK